MKRKFFVISLKTGDRTEVEEKNLKKYFVCYWTNPNFNVIFQSDSLKECINWKKDNVYYKDGGKAFVRNIEIGSAEIYEFRSVRSEEGEERMIMYEHHQYI